VTTGIGINVRTSTGKTEEIDFSSTSSADPKSLTIYYTTVTTSYVQTPSDLSLSDFFATYFLGLPQWVFVVTQFGAEIDQTRARNLDPRLVQPAILPLLDRQSKRSNGRNGAAKGPSKWVHRKCLAG